MSGKSAQVWLPFAALPTTECVRGAVANVLRDIQRDHDLTDEQLADRIGVHVNTIARARNKKGTLDLSTIARIGAQFGDEAVRPFTALWAGEREGDCNPVGVMGLAVSAIASARGPKAEMDALPTAKEAVEVLNAWIASVERKRLRVVG